MKVAQLCQTLCNLKDYTVHGILQGRILEWVAVPFSRGSFQPRDQTQVSHIADSLPTEPQRKPRNIGVVSLSLLQGIFPGQESNQGLLQCRQILYKLSYERSSRTSPKWLFLWPRLSRPLNSEYISHPHYLGPEAAFECIQCVSFCFYDAFLPLFSPHPSKCSFLGSFAG